MSASAAAPVAANDTAFVAEDSVVDVNVLANDTDADGGTLTIFDFTPPANGAVSVVTVAGVQRLRYDSNLNFYGSDSFTYRAYDGANTSNTATVTVTVTEVNDQPTADQESGTTNEDTPVDFDFNFLLTGDSPGPNESGQTLTITSVTQGAGGTATLGASAITFTPSPNYNGPAHFFYTVTDNGTTNGNPDPKTRTARVNVTVSSVNDAPVAEDDSYTVNEDTVLTVAAPGVLGNDTDESAAAMSATKTSNPAGGVVTLNSNGSFTFTPNANVNGTQSFTYTVFDGTLTSNTATVTITVVAVNDPPSATADARTTPEDVPLTLTSSNLTANDSKGPANEGTQTLTVTAVSAPENGTVSLVDGTATFTPAADFHGTARFTYTVTDNGTTNGVADPKSASTQVVITVTDVNDVPTAAADEKTTNEDTAVSFPAGDLLVNDSPGPFNESAQTLTLTAVGSDVDGTVSLVGETITFTPDPDFFGAASFGYTIVDNGTSNGAADPKQATGTVTVNVTGQSDGPPVVYDDSETTPEDTTLNASVPPATDPDGEPVTYAVVTGITGLTFNANGSYSYAPASNAHGTVSFTYKASDGIFDSNVATVTIIVTPVNDAPAAVADSYSTAEDTPLSVTAATGVLVNDSDIESSPLSAVLEFGPDHGTLTLNANGSLSYTPAANYNGSDSFTYRASDGNLTSNVATVTVTVTAVNDAPVAQDDAKSTAEDTVLNSSVPAGGET
jgi:large repetitive protein